MNFIKKLINGEFSLVKTFWLYGLITMWILVFIGARMFEYSIIYGFFAIVFIGLIYFAIQSIGLWRASNKYNGPRIWSVLSKFWVVLVALNYIKEAFFVIDRFNN